jgi:hypothetical protein
VKSVGVSTPVQFKIGEEKSKPMNPSEIFEVSVSTKPKTEKKKKGNKK